MPCSALLLAFSITISAIWTCLFAGSSKVEEITSPLTVRSISVTSSGLSSINKTINSHSGWLTAIDDAIFCKIIVFPAFGGATNNPLCPFPIGATKSITLAVISSVPPLPNSSPNLSLGCNGVNEEKGMRFLTLSGESSFTSETFTKAKYFSPFFGALIFPVTTSPVNKLKRLIWLGET